MLSLLTDFVHELRGAGVPVSMVEAIDAMEALQHIDWSDRSGLKATLAATMVKNSRHEPAFETVFEVYFAIDRRPPVSTSPEESQGSPAAEGDDGQGGSGGGGMDLDELVEALLASMAARDFAALRAAAQQAVDQLAGMEPGRPVGGTYYLYRTLRQLDVDSLERRLAEALAAEAGEGELAQRLTHDEVRELIERLREEIKAEIRRRLVADRGREAVAKTLRTPSLEEIDLMHATRSDLARIEEVIEPLTRKLAARLARRRRLAERGRLDFRKTMRASLATGGVPIDPRFRTTRPHRPEVFLLCDVSGSMATFARFTLQFTYAMSGQFSRLRSFVFVDAMDEVTDYLTPGVDFGEALTRITTEADVVWLDGHSDYGHALEQFSATYARDLTPRSTIIITGDARNNYREPRDQFLAEMADAVESVYWLNPEPRAYWDSGDSVMSSYARWCDAVYEVRNLAQLERFVEHVAVAPRRPRRRRRKFPSITPWGVPMSESAAMRPPQDR